MNDLTRVLHRVQQGDAQAADELFPLVYDELRRLAAHKMTTEDPSSTLQPTALVHEAWLRLGEARPSRSGKTGVTSSRQPPKPCAGSSLTGLGAKSGCATEVTWFDSARTNSNYVPTGWKGPPVAKIRAIKGHEYGLDLSLTDRAALIAFLRTL